MPDIFVATKGEESADREDEVKVISSEKNEKDTDNRGYIPIIDSKIHLFSSFCENPEEISFGNQEEDEKILLFLRRSRILNLKWLIFAVFLIIAPFFILPLISFTHIISFLPFRFILIFGLFYYLMIATYVYVSFITWYFNLVLITNIRIIDIDFSGLIYKNIATTKLSLVQDVSFQQIGVIRNLLDYGDILIQTAGAFENFHFEASPQPQKAVHIIEDLIGNK